MPNDSFYCSKEWINIRLYKLFLNPFCENKKCDNYATEVHHIKEKNYFPELAFDINNLQSLCKSCHSRHTYTNIKREFKPLKKKFI